MDAKTHLLEKLTFGRAHLNQIILGTRSAQYIDGLVLAEATGTSVDLWCNPAQKGKRLEAVQKLATDKGLKLSLRKRKNQ